MDFAPSKAPGSHFFQLSTAVAQQQSLIRLRDHIHQTLARDSRIEGVFCTAGAFEMADITSVDLLDSYKRMFEKNALSTLLAAHLGANYLADKGVLLLTGALAPFNEPQPAMLTYALSKNFVHALTLNLAKDEAYKQKNLSVYTILPSTIDTETNRKAMPDADTSQWLEPDKISEYLHMMMDGENRPESGSFIELVKQKGAVTGKIR